MNMHSFVLPIVHNEYRLRCYEQKYEFADMHFSVMKRICIEYVDLRHGHCKRLSLKGHNMQHSGHTGQKNQNELTVEIYSQSLVRAIGKVLRMTFS